MSQVAKSASAFGASFLGVAGARGHGGPVVSPTQTRRRSWRSLDSSWVSRLTSGVPPGAYLLSSLDHIFGPPSIGSVLDVDVAVASACSQPLISLDEQ